MKISLVTSIPKSQSLILFAFEKEKAPCALPKQAPLIQQAASEGFKAKECSGAILHPKSGSPAKQVILVGLGDKSKLTGEKLRRAAAAAIKKAQSFSQKSVSLLLPGTLDVQKESQIISEGCLLAGYRFDKYKSPDRDEVLIKNVDLIAPQKVLNEARKGIRFGQILSDATTFVRDMVNEPPSNLPPSKIGEIAKEIADRGESVGITVKVFDKSQIEEMRMGALLGVNRGSAEPPVFIHLHYRPQQAKPGEKLKSIALVGKGITFDSGGLSLKPAQSMETMKMDMAGAASILGVFKAIPQIKPKIEIHGILAVTENMPGGRAYKPGDVLQAMNGKSIEVLNTDAEGRLVLSDALAYAVKQNPDAIVDLATLTGACIVALGSLVAGAMGNDDDLFKAIQKASEESGEKFWQMPLVEEYRDGLKSPIADIKNISSVRGEAGSLIGGLFLKEFVGGKPWLHLDIAGPAWSDKEFHYLSHGGTGFPTRTLIHYLINQ